MKRTRHKKLMSLMASLTLKGITCLAKAVKSVTTLFRVSQAEVCLPLWCEQPKMVKISLLK